MITVPEEAVTLYQKGDKQKAYQLVRTHSSGRVTPKDCEEAIVKVLRSTTSEVDDGYDKEALALIGSTLEKFDGHTLGVLNLLRDLKVKDALQPHRSGATLRNDLFDLLKSYIRLVEGNVNPTVALKGLLQRVKEEVLSPVTGETTEEMDVHNLLLQARVVCMREEPPRNLSEDMLDLL